MDGGLVVSREIVAMSQIVVGVSQPSRLKPPSGAPGHSQSGASGLTSPHAGAGPEPDLTAGPDVLRYFGIAQLYSPICLYILLHLHLQLPGVVVVPVSSAILRRALGSGAQTIIDPSLLQAPPPIYAQISLGHRRPLFLTLQSSFPLYSRVAILCSLPSTPGLAELHETSLIR